MSVAGRVGRRGRLALAAALAVAVGAALLAGTVAGPSPVDGQAPPPEPGVVADLRREVAALRAGGLPADHPKVRMLEEEIDALVAGSTASTVPDPGMSGGRGGARAATPAQAAELADDLGAGQAAETGTVECEPVPPVLSADEAASALSCLSVPQPDGTSRYVAVQPDGRANVVRFGPGGDVSRLDDRQVPAGAAGAVGADGLALVPEPDGSVTVLAADRPVGTLDVG